MKVDNNETECQVRARMDVCFTVFKLLLNRSVLTVGVDFTSSYLKEEN